MPLGLRYPLRAQADASGRALQEVARDSGSKAQNESNERHVLSKENL